MQAKIQKWGNSRAVRLPISLLEAAGMLEYDQVEITAEKGCIAILPARLRHLTIRERIASYDGVYKCSEWDTGDPVGNEEW